MKKVLFVTYGGGHVNIAKHIYKYLENQYDYNLEIIALTSSIHVLKNENISYKEISSYIDLFDYKEEAIRYGEMLAQSQYNPSSGIDYDTIVAYLGLSFFDLVAQLQSYEKALELFQLEGRKVFSPVATMTKILEYEKPDVVVVSSNARMEKAAGISANNLNIPVIRINDMPTASEISYKATVCVMNDFAKEYCLQYSEVKENKIIVTGQPVFENNLRILSEKLNKVSHDLQRENYENLILLLTQIDYLDIDKIVAKLGDIAYNHPRDLFVIKLHPNQNMDSIHLKNIRNMLKVRDCEIKYLLKLCDVAITAFSTSGLEAALLDKPLIVTNFSDKKYIPDYSDYGIAVKVEDIEKLEQYIYNICLNKDNEKYQSLQCARKRFMNKENSTENIAKVIEQLV
jgi:UDP-N-acetylglucosamine 2-epimerase